MPSSITDINALVIGHNVQEICNKLSTLASQAKADINSGVTGYTGPTGPTGATGATGAMVGSGVSGQTQATGISGIRLGTGLSCSVANGIMTIWTA